MPANQAYFSLPNILRELPALNEDKNVNDDEGEKDVDLIQMCTSWSFEDFMNGQHRTKTIIIIIKRARNMLAGYKYAGVST